MVSLALIRQLVVVAALSAILTRLGRLLATVLWSGWLKRSAS